MCFPALTDVCFSSKTPFLSRISHSCMALWKTLFAAVLLSLSLQSFLTAAPDDLARARELEDSGQFKKAADLLKAALKDGSVTSDARWRYEWEIDRMERIRQDYSESTDALFKSLTRAVK